jgi:hypothetical protein
MVVTAGAIYVYPNAQALFWAIFLVRLFQRADNL